MGDTCPNHISNSYYRHLTFYYIGTLDPMGLGLGAVIKLITLNPKPPFNRNSGTRSERPSICHKLGLLGRLRSLEASKRAPVRQPATMFWDIV